MRHSIQNFIQTLKDILLILIWTVISMMFGGIWLDSWEINKIVLPLHYFIGPFIYLIVFLLGSRFLQKKVYHSSYIQWPPTFKLQYFIYGIALVVISTFGAVLIGGRLYFPNMDMYLFAQNAAGFIGTFLITPFIEELVFRGVILGQIAKRYGVIAGIIISSIIFGMVHLMNGVLDFYSMIQLVFSGTLMGVLLSIVYIREGSLWASFTVHALYNGLGSLIPVQTTISNDWPVIFLLKNNNRLITGGEYGFDCSLINNIAYILIILILLLILHRKGSSLKEAWDRAI